ncbi:hypothetical protein FJ978_07240 [Mesorhizobium sp. B1-1-7]|nr:hypothetical protein FJ978_07240 [Mesorhizobium sp. B1-1-7]
MENSVKSLDQRRPLKEGESEFETIGCRHSNPDICKNNSTPGKCAFVREDNICILPPRSWKKIFDELKRPSGMISKIDRS